MVNADTRLNPAALTPDDAAKLLTGAFGQAVDMTAIQEDIAAGAPVNADGTVNLMHYAAWLVRELNRGSD